jgi:hypothetical protein
MAAGGLSAVFTVLWMMVFALGGTTALVDPEARDALPGIGVLLAIGLVKLVLDGLTIYAGWQLRQLRNWTLCRAGSIAAMLPCSVCCLLGLPMGIWSLIVLLDNDVKQVFDGGGPPGGYGGPGGYAPPPGGYDGPPTA